MPAISLLPMGAIWRAGITAEAFDSLYSGSDHVMYLWMRLHGTFAVLMLIIAGSLLPVHVRVGWHQRKNLLAGCIIVAVLVLLIVSGYVLYYSDEETRPVVSALHWIIGLGAPVALVWHIVRGRGTHSTSDDLVGPR